LTQHPFFNKHTYKLDVLHLADHYGISSHIVANIFWSHVHAASLVLPGATQEARLDFLNGDIRAFYSGNGVEARVPTLKLSNLKRDGFPELHGNGIKAANTRALVPFAVDLQRRAVRMHPIVDNKHALKVVESLDKFYEVIYGADYFLTDAEYRLLVSALTRLGNNYQVLAVNSGAAGNMLWKQTVKLHYCIGHLAYQSQLLNPRRVQTYGSEGFVGKMANIYGMSMNGPHEAGLQKKILLKYTTGVAVDWSLRL